jgi:hypothetical protein
LPFRHSAHELMRSGCFFKTVNDTTKVFIDHYYETVVAKLIGDVVSDLRLRRPLENSFKVSSWKEAYDVQTLAVTTNKCVDTM